MTPEATRRGAWLPAATVVASLLVFWPWSSEPFSSPKLVVLSLGALAAGALMVASRRWPPSFAWPLLLTTIGAATLGPAASWEACVRDLGFALLVVGWSSQGLAPMTFSATAWAGATVAAISLAQAAGLDPFATLDPLHGETRLRVYGTLGNPDFVASVLTTTLGLTLASTMRWRWPLVFLQLGGLVVTRSMATWAAAAVALVVAGLHWARTAPRGRLWGSLGAAVVVLVLGLATVADRSPLRALRGRWYLLQVVAPHALDAPLLGFGPGSLESLWPRWELELWKQRCGESAACVAEHPDRPFAALQNHAHNDWLERLVEQGLVGLAALLWIFAAAARGLWLRAAPGASLLLGTLAAWAVRSAVDFPLARPADLCLLSLLIAQAVDPRLGVEPRR